jgi:DNA-binding transcriptional MerR regulator
LAGKTTAFLLKCGFDRQFGCTERLVRFYVTRGVLTPPEKDDVDRRKALFGPVQFRQLVVGRLLSERGWDLDRVIGQLQGLNGPKDARELDALINQLAEPTPSERMLFESRANLQVTERIELLAEPDPEERRRASAAPRSATERDRLARRILMEARASGSTERLVQLTDKLLRDPNLTPEEGETLRQLGDMARMAGNEPGRRERWTRIRLAPWCELNLRVSKSFEIGKKDKLMIMRNLEKILENYDSRDDL